MATPRRRPTPGQGTLEARKFLSSTTISTLSYAYPLRLLFPPPRPPARAALVFMLTYGGGLVAGDSIDLHIRVHPGAGLGLLTQGSTKIYKTPSPEIRTAQGMTVTVDAGGSLVLLPDPVQPFRGSAYEQSQVFHIDPVDANLLVLDWISEGRGARGEAWDFVTWKGRNEVWSLPRDPVDGDGDPGEKGRLLLRDNIRLDSLASAAGHSRDEMDYLGVFGTLLIKGPLFRELGKGFLDEFTYLPRIGTNRRFVDADDKPEMKYNVTWTAASVRGFVVIKFGAREVDEAKRWLRETFARDGTVAREFGEHYLMCLR